MQQKIVLIGGPSTGKTSVIEHLEKMGHFCMHEISREITQQAKRQGIDQLFLKDPILFSEKLLEGRKQQFDNANSSCNELIFFDRGIPDIFAYLCYTRTEFPDYFIEKSKEYIYDKVFLFLPWKKIHTIDSERYENFNQLLEIDFFIQKAYKKIGYQIKVVPYGTVEDRARFILNSIIPKN